MAMQRRTTGVGSTATLLLGLSRQALAAGAENWGPWGMHMMWGSWGIGMMIMMFLICAAIIVGIVFAIRWLVMTSQAGQHAGTGQGSESALDILKKRYARGEITKQEFEDIRRDL